MSRYIPLTILLLTVVASPVSAQTPAAEQSVIVTQGDASVKRAPDQARVSIAAEARAAKPGDAQRLSSNAMTALQAALKSIGLANDAVRTVDYSVRPDIEYANGTSRVKGYVAVNQVEVQVDDLTKVSQVIDAAGTNGATSITNLRFGIKDQTGAEREALRLAVQDAIGRAQAMASGAGKSLGPILKLEEGQRAFPPPNAELQMFSSRGPTQTPITPGETEVHAHVVLTVGIR